MLHHPINILHVVFSLAPGGMENGVVNLIRGLDPGKFHTRICCLEQEGAFAERLPQSRLVHVLGKQPGFSLRTMVQLWRLITQIKPHVIHSHNLGPLIYSGLASGLGLRCPILHGEHSLLPPEECQGKRLRQRHWFYKSCRKVHSVSEELKHQLVTLGLPADQIAVIPNGVDTEHFCPGDRSVARKQIGHVSENAFVLGIVGRFGTFKRHSLLIEAFERLAQHRADVHLLVVGGGGPEEQRVRMRAQASVAALRIHFTGFQNQLKLFYQAMNLLVVPSINEGMSNVILEAMACGLPILAHKVCGNAEMITSGINGLIADLDTADNLYHHLMQTLSPNTDLAEIGRTARETVVQRFSIAHMIDNYKRLYLEVSRYKRDPI